VALAVLAHPGTQPTEREQTVEKKSLAYPTCLYTRELRVLVQRYRNELMGEEERLKLRNRINRPKAKHGMGRLTPRLGRDVSDSFSETIKKAR
jgi:hypothetical protein